MDERERLTKKSLEIKDRLDPNSLPPISDRDLTPSAWYSFNSLLAGHEIYPQTSQLAIEVQNRMDAIYGPKPGDKVEIIIVHNNIPNAMALPGHLVVNDGLLKLVDCQEELDAFLAHEYWHITHHFQNEERAEDVFSSVGRARRKEIEADILPMELLDRRGINPHGVITLFKKLEAYEEENKLVPIFKPGLEPEEEEPEGQEGEEISIYEPVHGSLLDRRLNLVQMAWVVDVRNLSNSKTALPFVPEDFGKYVSAQELEGYYDNLSPIHKSLFLRKRIKELELSGDVGSLIDKQKQLLAETVPGLTSEQIDDLMMMVVYCGYEVPPGFKLQSHGEPIDIREWAKRFDTEDKVSAFFELLGSANLYGLGIELTGSEIEDVGNLILYDFLSHQTNFGIGQYAELVKKIPSKLGNESFFYAPYIEFAIDRNIFGSATFNQLIRTLAGIPIHMNDLTIYLTQRAEFKENTVIREVSSPASESISVPKDEKTIFQDFRHLDDIAIPIYFQLAKRIENPIEMLVFLDKYLQDLAPTTEDDRRNYLIEKEIRDLKIKRVSDKINHKELAGLILGYLRANGPDSLVNFQSGIAELYGKFRPVSKEKGDSYKDRFLLWAALSRGPGDFLNKAKDDLNQFLANEPSIEELDKLVTLLLRSPLTAKKLGFPINWKVEREDLARLSSLMGYVKDRGLKEAVEKGSPKKLINLIQNYPLYNVSGEYNVRFDKEGDPIDSPEEVEGRADLIAENWSECVRLALEKTKFRSSRERLLTMFSLGCLAADSQILLQVSSESARRIVASSSFDEGMKFIFEDFHHLPRHIFAQAIDFLVEQEPRTNMQLSRLESEITADLGRFLQDNRLIGEAAIVDGLFLDYYRQFEEKDRWVGAVKEENLGMDPTILLNALLESGVSDANLKRYLLDRWWMSNRLSTNIEVRKQFKVEDYVTYRGVDAELLYWLNSLPPIEKYKPLAPLVRDVYLSDNFMRQAALRKILVGKGGVLATEKGKQSLVDGLFNGILAEGTNAEDRIAEELITAFFKAGDQEELYEHLAGVLTSLILHQPPEQEPFERLAFEKADQKLDDMKKGGFLTRSTEEDRQFIATKIYRLMTGRVEAQQSTKEELATRLLAEYGQAKENGLSGRLYSPWEFGIIAGQQSGAVGVRTLQFSAETFTLPEEVREGFRNSFDHNKGQSRLQAFRTLKREANLLPTVKQLVNNITEIRPRVGGGSLMTVYEIYLRNGDHEILAVRNPNVLFHTENMVSLAQRTIDTASQDNPENLHYQLLGNLLGDVQEWIRDELSDPQFEKKDQLYREQNHEWSDGNSHYKSYVPKSISTGTRWIREEEFIEGKNLSELKVTESETDIKAGQISRDDYRQMIGHLVKNYMIQLSETGLVHSDIHPGNFRVTLDNQYVAHLDRYNLLELKDEEKNLILSTMTGMMMGNSEGATTQLVDYLLTLPVNNRLADSESEIKDKVMGALQSSARVEDSLMHALIGLKEAGLQIPLSISLILKNLLSLNQMSKEAGFNHLGEALLS